MTKKTEESIKKVVSKTNKIDKSISSTSVVKKSASKKDTVKKSIVKSKFASKKSTKKANPVKKVPSKVVSSSALNNIEYYDLPYKYNKTVVKILAQTPKTLFVYWEISNKDCKEFINLFGKDFFNKTVPVLIITNITKNYTFEIQINDFANSWYFNVSDEKCKYSVELGRRPVSTDVLIPNNYLYIASSNKIESPNGHVLFDTLQKTIYFKNTKTNESYSKDIANLHFITYMNKTYNIYELYKKLYKDEDIFNINNPTSMFK